MYCDHFKFSEKPFELTPDPKFLYESPGHRETLATLLYGIQERRGFIAIVGEPGTGKTTLLKALLERLDENTKVANIVNTDVNFKEMLNMALVDLRVATPEENLSKVEAIHRLNDFAIEQLFRGANVAILVDEAQNVDRRSMENLRLVSNLETRKRKLIQIVLSGQPELDGKLDHPELRQLAQRISLKRYITPLTEKETQEYIQHRLAIAGCKEKYFFALRAQQLVWEYSGGVPRKINILCDNALLIAYALKDKRVKAHVLKEAIKNLGWSPIPEKLESPRVTVPIEIEGEPSKLSKLKAIASHLQFAPAASVGITACFIFILGVLLGNTWLSFQNGESLSAHNPVGPQIAAEQSTPDEFSASALSTVFTQEDRVLEVASANAQEKEVEAGSGSVGEEIQAPGAAYAQAAMVSETASANVPERKTASVDSAPKKRPKERVTQPKASTQSRAHKALSLPQGPEALSLSKGKDEASSQAQLDPNEKATNTPEVALANARVRRLESIDVIPREKPKEIVNTPEEEDKQAWKSVTVKRGDIFSKLVSRVYGRATPDRIRLVRDHNPYIKNINNLEVGQKIIFPPPYTTE